MKGKVQIFTVDPHHCHHCKNNTHHGEPSKPALVFKVRAFPCMLQINSQIRGKLEEIKKDAKIKPPGNSPCLQVLLLFSPLSFDQYHTLVCFDSSLQRWTSQTSRLTSCAFESFASIDGKVHSSCCPIWILVKKVRFVVIYEISCIKPAWRAGLSASSQ